MLKKISERRRTIMNHRRRLFLFLALFAAVLLTISAQEFGQRRAAQPTKAYIVGGVRHGASFFPPVDYVMTRPKVQGQMDFLHYHTYDEVNFFLNKWAKDYPNLVDIYSVGKTFEGRDIWQITITNKATGKDTDKPAMFVEGNRHSGEVTAAECALWIGWYVLSNYGKDPEITQLVDTKTLYLKPKNNPDGSDLYLKTAQSNRSTVRPYDDDGDGLLDEDPPEDMDGDGFILQVRKKVELGKGTMMVDPNDKSGRLMIRAPEGKGDYLTYSEGIDNDGDGRINEDGIGGLDLHRNYVENWRPMPGLDFTGRGWTQGGAGEYPLSETETRAVVLFLLEHPNVSVGQTMDTSVPMLLHGPSTSRMEESMFPEDMKIYKYFDAEGKKITGYAAAGDTYWDYANQGRGGGGRGEGFGGPPMEGSAGGRGAGGGQGAPAPAEPRGSPLFGHSPDFGYLYYGAVWYGDELWNGGRLKDYDGDGRVTPLEQLRYIDEELGGKYFIPWHKFNHPTLGEVELGGFNPKFWNQNPPPELLEEWIKKEAMFNLLLFKSLPQVRIVSTKIQPVKKEADTFEIVSVFTNDGFLPTALKMADRIKIVRPDAAQISLPAGLEFAGSRARQDIGYLQSKQMKEVRWKVKGKLNPGAEAEVSISSTRGGMEKTKVKLLQ
jgi:Zinc carboxypeptidase